MAPAWKVIRSQEAVPCSKVSSFHAAYGEAKLTRGRPFGGMLAKLSRMWMKPSAVTVVLNADKGMEAEFTLLLTSLN